MVRLIGHLLVIITASIKCPLASEESDKADPGLDVGEGEWLFAYGANIGSAKLKALNVSSSGAVVAKIPGYGLFFNAALGKAHLGEPAFADVASIEILQKGGLDHATGFISPVHGVLRKVTPEELLAMDKTELPLYRRQQVKVSVLWANAKHVLSVAWAYVGTETDSGDRLQAVAPSARYGRLVACGVEEQIASLHYLDDMMSHLGGLGLNQTQLACDEAGLKPKLHVPNEVLGADQQPKQQLVSV